MKKLLFVPAILVLTTLSGGVFAQGRTGNNVANGSGTNANSSRVFVIGSPAIQTQVAVPVNVSVGSAGSQTNGVGQSNASEIGIGGPQSQSSSIHGR